jgi:hypothetical protein
MKRAPPLVGTRPSRWQGGGQEMGISRRTAFQIACLGLGLGACRTSVAGRYELDLEATKVCVANAKLDDPEEAQMRDETIKLLALTTVDVLLGDSGQLQSTTQLNGPAPRTQISRGTWRADGKRLIMKLEGEGDTSCEVDGPRLRCEKPKPNQLLTSYVLVRQ